MHLKTLEIAFPRVFLSQFSGEEYLWIPLISPVVTRIVNHQHKVNLLRDGPLENLWGGRAKYKKKIRAREN